MAEMEIWQGNGATLPYRWLVRDAEPPRYWYGARDDGRGGLTFERIPDDQLAEHSDQFSEPADEAARTRVGAAFREQVLGQSP